MMNDKTHITRSMHAEHVWGERAILYLLYSHLVQCGNFKYIVYMNRMKWTVIVNNRVVHVDTTFLCQLYTRDNYSVRVV